MRLLTHNMMACPRTKAHPLILRATTCDDVSLPFQPEFVQRMIPRLDWPAFLSAAEQFPDPDALALLPKTAPDPPSDLSDDVLRAIHRLLLEWHVVDGELAVDGADQTYLIRDGVPNLILTEVRAADDTNGALPAVSGDDASADADTTMEESETIPVGDHSTKPTS